MNDSGIKSDPILEEDEVKTPVLKKKKKQKSTLTLLDLQLEVWKTAVNTQMHFNDMSAKARQHGISLIVVIIGFAFFLMTRGSQENFFVRGHHISYYITLLPPIVLSAVCLLDLFVYHKMLKGAVSFGRNFEELVIVPKIIQTKQGMTELITIYSRFVCPYSFKDTDGGKIYKGCFEITAGTKLLAIYIVSIFCLSLIPYWLYDLPKENGKNNTSVEEKKQSSYEKKNSSPRL